MMEGFFAPCATYLVRKYDAGQERPASIRFKTDERGTPVLVERSDDGKIFTVVYETAAGAKACKR